MFLVNTDETVEAIMADAVSATAPVWYVTYADHTTTTLTPGQENGVLNGTTEVEILSSPAASTQRQVKYINIYNADVVTHTISVNFEDGSTERLLVKAQVFSGEVMTWSAETGWRIGNNPFLAQLLFLGARVSFASSVSLTSGSSTTIDFDTEDFDSGGFHSNVTNPSRLTVPAGVTKVVVTAGVDFAANATGRRLVTVVKNGSTSVGQHGDDAAASGNHRHAITTGVLEVSEGDYFTVVALQNSGGDLDFVTSQVTAFSIYVLETTAQATASTSGGAGTGVQNIELGGFVGGAPAINTIVFRYLALGVVDIAADLAGSQGHVGTVSDAETDFDVQVNGVSKATIQFASATATANFPTASAFSLVAGDRLDIVTPADLNLIEDFSFTIQATK